MSSDSIFTSFLSETIWVHAIDKIFLQPQTSVVSTRCSVFRVPKNLTEEKPEGYAPHHLGLGPYHHLRPDFYKTLPDKLAAIWEYNSENIRLVVDALIPMEPEIRASYDQYLDLRIETLARILAIDGLYLLQFLKYYPGGRKDLAGDIMMLENQVPGFVLKEIQLRLELGPENEQLRSFLRDQSPLDWDNQLLVDVTFRGRHLLGIMYDSIVYEEPVFGFAFPKMAITSEDVETGVRFLGELGVPGASIAGQILSFVNMIPWSKITGLFKKRGGVEPIPLAKKIDVPSVSEMSKAAGIKFINTTLLRLIKFEESEKEFHLPVIRITTTTEVVLRNLVAYEEASSRPELTHKLAEYLDLMCGIIHNANDVKILKEDQIINSQLGDEEIAHIFNGFSKSTRKSKKMSELDKTIAKVNQTYNNLARVKFKAFFKKYVYGLLKVLGVLISIVVSILLVLKAFCSVFGCTRWFSKSPLGNQGTLFSF